MESSLVSNNHMSVTRKGELSLLVSCKKKVKFNANCSSLYIAAYKDDFFKSLYDSLSSLVERMFYELHNQWFFKGFFR